MQTVFPSCERYSSPKPIQQTAFNSFSRLVSSLTWECFFHFYYSGISARGFSELIIYMLKLV